jgi:hypothetical protein
VLRWRKTVPSANRQRKRTSICVIEPLCLAKGQWQHRAFLVFHLFERQDGTLKQRKRSYANSRCRKVSKTPFDLLQLWRSR